VKIAVVTSLLAKRDMDVDSAQFISVQFSVAVISIQTENCE
jgi:hypothetical protein